MLASSSTPLKSISEMVWRPIAESSKLARRRMPIPARSLSSSSRSMEPGPSNYPFSSTALTPPPPPSSSNPPENLLHPKRGSSLVTHLNTELLRSSLDPSGALTTLFSRRAKDRVLPGSVLSITSYTSPARTNTSTYSGVLLSIRRRGVDTSFRVRNMVGKIGVETSFKLYSPMIQSVKVVKRADGKSGIRDMGRAKVNYLRERPGVLANIASALKTKGGK